MKKDLPVTVDPDKYCSYVFEEPDERAGNRCEGFHIKDSPYCLGHSERKHEIAKARQQKIEKLKELNEELNSYQSTKTKKDVQALNEKVINGILQGLIKKDKAAPLGVFIPLAWKMANDLDQPGGNGIKIDLTQTKQTITLNMSEDQMDQYLAGNEHVRVEILEQMQSDGKVKVNRRKKDGEEIITIEPGDVKPEDVKTDATTIAKISEKTGLPVTRKQAIKLFGKNMGDKTVVHPGPDPTGFDDLFAKDRKGKELGLPAEALHKWKGGYEENPDGKTASLWFTCQQCGQKVPNVKRELCPAGGKPRNETEQHQD